MKEKNINNHKIRLVELDFLRGVAVILVLFRHHDFIHFLNMGGWIGVDLFFVLSGFLVSGLLFNQYKNNKKVRIGNFLLRRGLKIYPLFYLMLLISIFFKILLSGYEINWNFFLYESLFIQNYFSGFWNHTWSIAIEEHFYLALCILIYLMTLFDNLDNTKYFTIICLTILVFCLLARFYNFNQYTFTAITHLYPTHLRIDSLVFGVLISYYYSFHKEIIVKFFSVYKRILILISFMFLLPPFILRIDNYFMNTIGLTFLYVAFGIILITFIIDKSALKFLKMVIGNKIISDTRGKYFIMIKISSVDESFLTVM